MNYPTLPPDLQFAMVINWDNLRHWEYLDADAHVMYKTQTLRAAFEEGQRDQRAMSRANEEHEGGA